VLDRRNQAAPFDRSISFLFIIYYEQGTNNYKEPNIA
jgi:hypothetical protein